ILFPRSSAVRAAGLIVFGSLLGLSFASVERRLSFGVLRVLNGALKGREYLLNRRSTRIGEDPHCDVPVSGYRLVSPVHALVARRGRDLVIESVAGPLTVNDDKIEAGAVSLKYDDVIACGGIRLMLRRE
ncbi:MAG: FHA domain-containing protein, partial [Treponemataceae bacterium]